MPDKKKFKYYNIISIFFITCLITSNIAATKLWQFYSFTLPGGMLVFPLLYVLNDILTEVYGFSASRRVIWIALFANLFLTIVMSVVVMLPPAEHWSNHESFSNVFSLTPRIFIASITSYFIGELMNASVISTLKIMLEGKSFGFRAIFSTCVGALVETSIFIGIAFSSIMPVNILFSMIMTLTVIKVLYELILLPVTTTVASYLKKVENFDSYEKPSWRGVLGW